MQKRLHNFMDKMQDKPVEDRRKLLFKSTVASGVLIAFFGLWNISGNLMSLNTTPANFLATEENGVDVRLVDSSLESQSGLAQAPRLSSVQAPSAFSVLADNVAGVWNSIRGSLKDLNDKLNVLQRGAQATINEE